MANTSRTVIIHDNGPATDYTGAKRHDVLMTEAPTEGATENEIVTSTTEHTIRIDHVTTCHRMILENTGSIAIRVKWRQIITAAKAYANCDFVVGPPGTLTDADTGSTFLTDGATDGSYVTIASAVDSGNNTTFAVQDATTDILTFNESETIAEETGDAITIEFLQECFIELDGGDSFIITDPQPSFNVLVTAKSSTPSLKYSFTGV